MAVCGLGVGVLDCVCMGWSFQFMGFGACCVGLSGFYGVGVLYINIKKTLGKNI